MARFRLPHIVSILLMVGWVVLVATSHPLFSARSANEEMRIYPATPTFSQPFFVTLSGQSANSCVPAFHSLILTENSLHIEAKTPGPLVSCLETQTNWSFSVIVPPHPPNFHVALLAVISGITGETLSSARHEFDVVGGIQIIPALPLTTEDVTLRLADLSLDSCTPEYISHDVITQTITIEAQVPDLVCGQVPTPWQIDAAVDPLPAGEYQVEMFVTDTRETPPRRTRLLDGAFVVAETLHSVYLPLSGYLGSNIAAQRGALP
jgi:hypothetical protein